MLTAARSVEQVLAELEMCSHVSAVNMNPSSRDAGEDIGGKRPPGGVDGREDRYRDPLRGDESERVLRSAQHYRNQLARGRPDSLVLRDAEASLAAWRQSPPWRPGAMEPPKGSLQWKRMIADSPDNPRELARRHEISARTVYNYRALYAERPEAA